MCENIRVPPPPTPSGGQGSLDPPENRRNIVFSWDAVPDPLKNHKVANLVFNVGPSSVCQQIQWRFAGSQMSSR